MIQKYSRYRILQEFFNFPRKQFQIRELSRNVHLSQSSITLHIKELLKENLIVKEKTSIYPAFKANRDSNNFKFLKRFDITFQIKNSELLNFIYDSCLPQSIILFGSASKGEDTENSDLDLFIQSNEKKLDLEKYEKELSRKINLFFEKDFSRLSKELKNNILNGIILKGYIKVF